MFAINEDLSIYVTRGDIAFFDITAKNTDGTDHVFMPGDIVRISVCKKKDCTTVYLRKDFYIAEETEVVGIYLSSRNTRFGEAISKPVDYWYEIELNPDTNPQTIICYDEDGTRVFRLYPEIDGEVVGGNEEIIANTLSLVDQETGEVHDLYVSDGELMMESERPTDNDQTTEGEG